MKEVGGVSSVAEGVRLLLHSFDHWTKLSPTDGFPYMETLLDSKGAH